MNGGVKSPRQSKHAEAGGFRGARVDSPFVGEGQDRGEAAAA